MVLETPPSHRIVNPTEKCIPTPLESGDPSENDNQRIDRPSSLRPLTTRMTYIQMTENERYVSIGCILNASGLCFAVSLAGDRFPNDVITDGSSCILKSSSNVKSAVSTTVFFKGTSGCHLIHHASTLGCIGTPTQVSNRFICLTVFHHTFFASVI